MLTDYHVHLRPDDESPDYLTVANIERYLAAAGEQGIAELGVSEHVHRFRRALDVWQHPFWQRSATDDIDEYCRFIRDPGAKKGTDPSFAVDMEGDWDVWTTAGDPETVWRRYFETLGEAARSGMFDILAHPDLVKVFGSKVPAPEGDLRRFYDRAMEGIAESDVAIEVSTAGLRKPIGELYPARPFLEMCLDAGRPVALSSDAHTPEQLGYEYERAAEWLSDMGVTEVSVFSGRTRTLEPLG